MKNYSLDAAIVEASRCLMCEDAPCFNGCPAHVNPKYFIRRIRFRDFAGAVKMLRDANVMAASTSYICPCLSTCCSKCTSEKLSRPIDISGLQRFVMDWERENGMISPEKNIAAKGKVAVVGSGPAGLACAASLASRHVSVTIYDESRLAGGQLALSIPDFRLPKEVVKFEVEFVKKLGVKFVLGKKISSVEKLAKENDAVFVAAGLMKPKELGIAGENRARVVTALDLLMRHKAGKKINFGKRVLVIGGGDTAIDASRVAARSGSQVIVLYRRTQKEMPAYRHDIELAFSEGVEFYFRVVPVEITGGKNSDGVILQRVRWLEAGRGGQKYEAEGEPFFMQGDLIVNAIGQERAEDIGAINKNQKNIFSGGDFAEGAGTAVGAVNSGKIAAEKIVSFLKLEKEKFKTFYPEARADLSVTFCGVKFENPFILAAAPPTDELEMLEAGLKKGWAGAVLKTTSVEGTKVPLKYPMMSGIDAGGEKLIAMGNIDLISAHHIDEVERRVRYLKKRFPNKVLIGSIMGSTKEEWQSLVLRLSDAGADMIECSFSCPQGSLGAKAGQMLAQDVEATAKVASWVKEAAASHKRNLPVVIKITPHVTDVCEIASALKAVGVDAICASNTIQSLMGIDLETFVPFPNVEGKSSYSGMSGPAIKPQTLKVISEIAKNVGIPIVGTGGPVTWADAVEFMLCGASVVQFCTAVMRYGFDIIDDLLDGFATYLDAKKIRRVSSIVGASLPFIAKHDELTYKKDVISRIDSKKCIRDGLCFIACRDGGHRAIELDDDRAPRVIKEKCVGCGLCKLVCPVTGCISMTSKK